MDQELIPIPYRYWAMATYFTQRSKWITDPACRSHCITVDVASVDWLQIEVGIRC